MSWEWMLGLVRESVGGDGYGVDAGGEGSGEVVASSEPNERADSIPTPIARKGPAISETPNPLTEIYRSDWVNPAERLDNEG